MIFVKQNGNWFRYTYTLMENSEKPKNLNKMKKAKKMKNTKFDTQNGKLPRKNSLNFLINSYFKSHIEQPISIV